MIKSWIENNFGVIILITVVIAFLFPQITPIFSPFPEYALMLVLFFTFLKMDFGAFREVFIKPFPIFFFIFLNLLLIPALIYFGFSFLGMYSAALAFLLVSAAPAPAASAVLADLCRGNPHYALSITIISSFLCPVTIPALINILTPSEVDISFFEMFWQLFKIIIIPFIIALPFKYFTKNIIKKTKSYYSLINVFLLTIVLLGAIDGLQAKVFNSPELLPVFFTVATLYFVIKYILGFILGFWMKPDIRVSYGIVSAFINIGLIIVFAKRFFAETMGGEVILFIVLVQVLWNISLLPLQKFSQWFIKKTNAG